MRLLVFLILFALPSASFGAEDSLLRYRVSLKASSSESDYVNTVVPAYISSGRDADLDTLQCPIPREDRVRNFTGIQCVWSSIETLGRWAGEERLFDPPLTSRRQCKSYAGPGSASGVLNSLGVRFEQTYGDRERGLAMIRRAMKEGRGALFDVPGHAMVIVHFDEEGDRVCWVDNSDNTLKAQTSTLERFMKRWGSWVLVVYAEEDIVPHKAYRRHIPVFSEGDPLPFAAGNFVPVPTYIGSNGSQ
jgi:hypothetical protein